MAKRVDNYTGAGEPCLGESFIMSGTLGRNGLENCLVMGKGSTFDHATTMTGSRLG